MRDYRVAAEPRVDCWLVIRRRRPDQWEEAEEGRPVSRLRRGRTCVDQQGDRWGPPLTIAGSRIRPSLPLGTAHTILNAMDRCRANLFFFIMSVRALNFCQSWCTFFNCVSIVVWILDLNLIPCGCHKSSAPFWFSRTSYLALVTIHYVK